MASKNIHYAAELIAAARVGKTVQDYADIFDNYNPGWKAINFLPGMWYYEHRTDPLPALEVNCDKLWDVAKKYIPTTLKLGGHSYELQTIGAQYGFYQLTDVWARGGFDADSVVQAWIGSWGHYATMMSPHITQVAVAQQSQTWSAIFAAHCVS